MTLTRREFIKHSGIAAGALVVTSAAPLPAWAEEKGGKILTAGRWGAMNVEVKDGKIVSSTGALAKTIPNSLQSTAADQVHTTARIQHPMVRKSYLDNPLQPVKLHRFAMQNIFLRSISFPKAFWISAEKK